MAYPGETKISKSPSGDTSGSLIIDLPNSLSGEFILISCSNDGGGTPLSLSGSWTELGTQIAARGSRSAIFYKISNGAETNPTLSGHTDGFAAVCTIYHDVDSSNPIDAFAQSNYTSSTQDPTCPSVTSITDNTLIIRVLGGWDSGGSKFLGNPNKLFIGKSTDGVVGNIVQAETSLIAGSTGTFAWEVANSDGGSAYTISLKNSIGGTNSILFDGGYEVINRYGSQSTYEPSITFTSLGLSVLSIGGISVDTNPSFSVNTTSNIMVQSVGLTSTTCSFNTPGDFFQGVTQPVTIDATGKILSAVVSNLRSLDLGVGGLLFIVFDSLGSWSAFNEPNPGASLVGNTFFVTEGSSVFDSSGVLDWSDIVKVGYAWHKNSTSGSSRGPVFRDLMLISPPTFTGGGENYPISFSNIIPFLQPHETIDYSNLQGRSQSLAKFGLNIGDGVNDIYLNVSNQSLEFLKAGDKKWRLVDGDVSIIINATDASIVNLQTSIISTETQQIFSFDATSSLLADYSTSGFIIIGYIVEWQTGILCDSISFIENPSVNLKSVSANLCTFTGSINVSGSACEITAGASLLDFVFNKGLEDYAIEITQAGSYSLNRVEYNGYVNDLNITASTGVVTIQLDAGESEPSYITAGATVVFSQPLTTFTINSNQSNSLIQIFNTGTQTIIDSIVGSSLIYEHSGEVVDIVVQKANYLPQRFTNKTLLGTEVLPVNLLSDPVYISTHGLVYPTDASWDRVTNKLTIPTFGPIPRDVYSLMIDSFISESSLRNTAFNIQMNGFNSMFLIDDAEGVSDSDITNMRRGGVKYIDSTGVVTAEWLGIQSIGDVVGFTGRYQQLDGIDAVEARVSGNLDELVKIYGDLTHGDFNYKSHFNVKFQENGFRESRISIIDTFEISTLEPTLYLLPMQPVEMGIALGDPGLSITIIDHGASPVNWNGEDFSITIIDSAAPSSGVNILRELNYNLAQLIDFQGKPSFNWPEMIVESGDLFETIRGYTEGNQSSTLKGVRVLKNDGVSPHPDFFKFQADNGNYYQPPSSITISAPNLLDGSRVRLYNNTKLDEINNSVVSFGGGYSITLIENIDFEVGDSLILLSTFSDGLTAKRVFRGTAVATTSNIVFNDIQSDWDEYNDAATDGSDVPECSTNYLQVKVNVIDSDNSTTKVRIAAFITYALTTADGIRNWVSLLGTPVIDYVSAGSAVIDKTVANVEIDNLKPEPLDIIDPFKLRASDYTSLIESSTYTINFDNTFESVVVEVENSDLTFLKKMLVNPSIIQQTAPEEILVTRFDDDGVTAIDKTKVTKGIDGSQVSSKVPII